MSNNFALKEYFFVEFFLNESSWKALSEHLEIKNFENSPFLTLADTLNEVSVWTPTGTVHTVVEMIIMDLTK